MKRSVLLETTLFHPLLTKNKENGVVLNDTIHLLLPLDVHRQGKKEIFSPITPLSLSFPKPQTNRQGSHPTSCPGRGRRRFSPLQRISPSLSQNPKQSDEAHTPPRALPLRQKKEEENNTVGDPGTVA
jgi:hypothetical protein